MVHTNLLNPWNGIPSLQSLRLPLTSSVNGESLGLWLVNAGHGALSLASISMRGAGSDLVNVYCGKIIFVVRFVTIIRVFHVKIAINCDFYSTKHQIGWSEHYNTQQWLGTMTWLYLVLYLLEAKEMGEKSSTCKLSSTCKAVLVVFTLQMIWFKLNTTLAWERTLPRHSM